MIPNFNVKDLERKFQELQNIVETSPDDCEDILNQLQTEIVIEIETLQNLLSNTDNYLEINSSLKVLESMSDWIDQFKNDYGYYDEKRELDSMFPDRYDEDFDDESMSYDSVFGEE
jgi:conjugal transfer/entry exclusion protein